MTHASGSEAIDRRRAPMRGAYVVIEQPDIAASDLKRRGTVAEDRAERVRAPDLSSGDTRSSRSRRYVRGLWDSRSLGQQSKMQSQICPAP